MLKRLGYSLRPIWYSYIPIPNLLEYHFWNQNIVEISKLLKLFALLMSLFFLFFSILIFMNKPIVLFFYLSGTSGILIFSWLKFMGTLRHHGNLFIVFFSSYLVGFLENNMIFRKFFIYLLLISKNIRKNRYNYLNYPYAIRHICL